MDDGGARATRVAAQPRHRHHALPGNMLLVSPHTQAADAEPLAQALAGFIAELRA